MLNRKRQEEKDGHWQLATYCIKNVIHFQTICFWVQLKNQIQILIKISCCTNPLQVKIRWVY